MWVWLACAEQPLEPAAVRSFVIDPPRAHRTDLQLTLERASAVAVACTRLDDPREVHLLEAGPALVHQLPLGGLRADTEYECAALPLDPAGDPTYASFRTGPAAEGQVTALALRHAELEPTGAYTLANVQRDCMGEPLREQYLVMFDLDGEVRWREELPDGMNFGIEARYHGDGEIVWGGGGVYGKGAPSVLHLFEGPRSRVPLPGADELMFHHDGKRVGDGLVLTTELTLHRGWMDFQLRLADERTGATEWLYESDEGVAGGWLFPGDPVYSPDPYHLDFADLVETERGPVVVASLCTPRLVVALDLATREPRWRLGPTGDLQPVSVSGELLPSTELPQCAHGLELEGDQLLVYDNGQQRGFSQASQWTIDEDEGTARLDWSWSEPGWFETALGDVDWLGPGRVLVTEAHGECFSPTPGRPHQIVEVDQPSGEVVHRLIFEDVSDSGYRSERLDGCLFADTRSCPGKAERWRELQDAVAAR